MTGARRRLSLSARAENSLESMSPRHLKRTEETGEDRGDEDETENEMKKEVTRFGQFPVDVKAKLAVS